MSGHPTIRVAARKEAAALMKALEPADNFP